MSISTATGILNSQASIPLGQAQKQWATQEFASDTVFSGYVRVDKLLNGYVVHFSKNEGSITQKYVALTIKEVNEIITSEMVKFKLES